MKYSLYEIVKLATTNTESFEECIDNQIELISNLFDDLLTSFTEEVDDEATQSKIKELLFNKVLDVIELEDIEKYLEYRKQNNF